MRSTEKQKSKRMVQNHLEKRGLGGRRNESMMWPNGIARVVLLLVRRRLLFGIGVGVQRCAQKRSKCALNVRWSWITLAWSNVRKTMTMKYNYWSIFSIERMDGIAKLRSVEVKRRNDKQQLQQQNSTTLRNAKLESVAGGGDVMPMTKHIPGWAEEKQEKKRKSNAWMGFLPFFLPQLSQNEAQKTKLGVEDGNTEGRLNRLPRQCLRQSWHQPLFWIQRDSHQVASHLATQ